MRDDPENVEERERERELTLYYTQLTLSNIV